MSHTLLRSLAQHHVAMNATGIGVGSPGVPPQSTSSIWGAIVSNILLFILVFGLSATVHFKALRREASNKLGLGIGLGLQFLILPLFGYIAVLSMTATKAGFTEAMGISLLVVVSSPGGSFANFFCSLFNAELALSVALTTLSSLLSIGFLPANLFLYTYAMYGNNSSIVNSLNFGTIFLSLGVVLAAIFSGIWAGHRWHKPSFHVMANRVGTAAGLLLIVYSLFLSSGANGAESKLWNQEWSFYIGVMIPCVLGLLTTAIVGRASGLTHPETVAAAIGCCYRNTGIATSVAVTVFKNVERRAQAAAVPLFYGVVQTIVIITYSLVAWKCGWTKAPPSENLFKVIAKTYEADESEPDSDDSNAGNGDGEETDVETAANPQGELVVVGEGHEDDEVSLTASRASFRSTVEDGVSQHLDTRRPGLFARLRQRFRRTSRTDPSHETEGQVKDKRSLKIDCAENRSRLESDMTQQTVSSAGSHSVSSPAHITVRSNSPIARQRSIAGPLEAVRVFDSVAEGSCEESEDVSVSRGGSGSSSSREDK